MEKKPNELTLTDVNGMKKDELREALKEVLFAKDSSKENSESGSESSSDEIGAILSMLRTINDEVKELKTAKCTLLTEVRDLKAQVTALQNKPCPSCANAGSASSSNAPIGSATSKSFADAVRRSVHSALKDDQAKNDVMISKAEENGRDQEMIAEVCDKLNFTNKPVEMRRLGARKENYQRLLQVSFSNHFDARTFRARFEERKKVHSDLPHWHLRFGRTEEEQSNFVKTSKLAFKLNKDAKDAKLNESYSLRHDGSIWKFVRQEDGTWKRDKQWRLTEEEEVAVSGQGNC